MNEAQTERLLGAADRIAAALERLADATERANLTNPLDVLRMAMEAAEKAERPPAIDPNADQAWRFK